MSIHYEVNDEDGHLAYYCLSVHYAEDQVFNIVSNCYATPQKGNAPTAIPPAVGAYPWPSYSQALIQGATRPHWYGGKFKVELHGSDIIPFAYLFRLRVWKRTPNGCWLIYRNFG